MSPDAPVADFVSGAVVGLLAGALLMASSLLAGTRNGANARRARQLEETRLLHGQVCGLVREAAATHHRAVAAASQGEQEAAAARGVCTGYLRAVVSRLDTLERRCVRGADEAHQSEPLTVSADVLRSALGAAYAEPPHAAKVLDADLIESMVRRLARELADRRIEVTATRERNVTALYDLMAVRDGRAPATDVVADLFDYLRAWREEQDVPPVTLVELQVTVPHAGGAVTVPVFDADVRLACRVGVDVRWLVAVRAMGAWYGRPAVPLAVARGDGRPEPGQRELVV